MDDENNNNPDRENEPKQEPSKKSDRLRQLSKRYDQARQFAQAARDPGAFARGQMEKLARKRALNITATAAKAAAQALWGTVTGLVGSTGCLIIGLIFVLIFLIIIISALGKKDDVLLVATPTPTPVCDAGSVNLQPAPNFSEFITKYGFNNPLGTGSPTVSNYPDAFAVAAEAAQKWSRSGLDPQIVLWWNFFDTKAPYDSYHYSNCGNRDYDVNTNCDLTGGVAWQLGYGVQFAQYRRIPEAMGAIYGSAGSPGVTQAVGQEVLRQAGQSQTFPAISVLSLVDSYSTIGDAQSKYWLSVLMRDPAISAYIISRVLYSASQPLFKTNVWNWPPPGYYETRWPNASNLMNDIVNYWNTLTSSSGGQCSTGVGDISQCLYYRYPAQPAAFQSKLLFQYFDEAAKASGVPAVLLAAFARVESPSSVNWTDDIINNQVRQLGSPTCPGSSWGATGLMQVVRWGLRGSPHDGILLGAGYLGLNGSSLTEAQYCDVRTSIFLGAGVINAKMGGQFDVSKLYDQNYLFTLAQRFFGCTELGGLYCSPTKQVCYSDGSCITCGDPAAGSPTDCSYGMNLYKSVTNCKPDPGGGSTIPIEPPPPGDLRQNIINRFGVTLNGYDQTQLVWAWEIFSQIAAQSSTFFQLANGVIVQRLYSGTSGFNGCYARPHIDFRSPSTAQSFKVVIIHEIGHYIRACNTRAETHEDEVQAAINSEGGMTAYARALCYTNTLLSEDYSEMTAYIFNRNSPPRTHGCTASCCPREDSVNPFANCPGTLCRYPLHFDVGRRIYNLP